MSPSPRLVIAGDCAVSPPASGTSKRRASARNPSRNLSSQAPGKRDGIASDKNTAMGSAPIAARSLNPRARQRYPTDSGGCQARRKCAFSRVKSVVTQISNPDRGRNTAQSSPIPSETHRDPTRDFCRIASIKATSPEIGRIGLPRFKVMLANRISAPCI